MSYTPMPAWPETVTDDWLIRAGYKRGYWSSRSKVAHLYRPNEFDGSDQPLCGQVGGMVGAEALGTGTQDEYDRARELPLCARCSERVSPVQAPKLEVVK